MKFPRQDFVSNVANLAPPISNGLAVKGACRVPISPQGVIGLPHEHMAGRVDSNRVPHIR
jgi:hypothetical protein